MAESKVFFYVGVFGIPAKLVNGVIKIKCNVRTDQEKQREIAQLPSESKILLVDCPGGAVKHGDESLDQAMNREIGEETGGCQVQPLTLGFFAPLELMGKRLAPYDLAFWKPIILIGQPKPSDEASDHVWLSRQELETGDKYRPVSGLGLAGRTGRMMIAALNYFESRTHMLEIFS